MNSSKTKLSGLTFVLLFDAELKNFEACANTVYYVLPGYEYMYSSVESIITNISMIVADCVAQQKVPAGYVRAALVFANFLTRLDIESWTAAKIDYYSNLGINPLVRKTNGDWVIWGQRYFDRFNQALPIFDNTRMYSNVEML
jgi:hypothetical protein